MRGRRGRRSAALAGVLACACACALPRIADAQEERGEITTVSEDPLVVKLRAKFKEGVEKYRAGQYGEAILVWNPIYKEIAKTLGPSTAYRLAFNLARAFDQIHDEPQAADHYQAYIDEVEARQSTGQTLEPVVLKQREEADERMTVLRAKLARVHFHGELVPVAIDSGEAHPSQGTSYVMPGRHTIVWRALTSKETRTPVDAQAGAVLELEPPPLPEEAPLPPPVAPPPIRWETRTEHPFPKSVLYVGAAATALSFVIPPLLYSSALATKDDYDAARTLEAAQGPRDDYASRKTFAYASWAIPAVLGTTTIALALYWFYGEKTVRTPVGISNGALSF